MSVHGEVFSPLTHFMELFGYENALVNFILDGGKTHAILDHLTEASISFNVVLALERGSALVEAPRERHYARQWHAMHGSPLTEATAIIVVISGYYIAYLPASGSCRRPPRSEARAK